ncbi:MAG: nitroreductase family protein, partial [PVC group bacterium]
SLHFTPDTLHSCIEMNIKSLVKRLPGFPLIARLLFNRSISPDTYRDLCRLSNEQLLSLMCYESHRIEKAFYNNLLKTKPAVFQKRHHRLGQIYRILSERGSAGDSSIVAWSRGIYNAFPDLEAGFIRPRSAPPPEFHPEAAEMFLKFLRSRRSVRVWAEQQPPISELRRIALLMIDAARWAPNSCNRQTWRFRILHQAGEKALLKKLKEEHCTRAPLLIFVGIDTRLYGGMGKEERSIYIDAGAAITQMLLVAHRCGLGSCWNHLGDDLINSRQANRRIYARFAEAMSIPAYIAPVALVALGRPAFTPPCPARMERAGVMIGRDG